MGTATEVTDVDLASWGPGARFFATSDETYFVVQADLADYAALPDTIVRQPTVILYTDPFGRPDDLTVDHQFPPGTTHEDAITGAGYTLQETP